MPANSDSGRTAMSRRQVPAAGSTGLLAARPAARPAISRAVIARAGNGETGGGTPEQVHLTWDDDPATSMVVSWVSPARSVRPRVRIGQRVFPAEERARADGERLWTYHARVGGLRPGATYGYAVTADNAADPFSATFTTAPAGRAKFRFTSSGDLAADCAQRGPACGQSASAAAAVETFQPLFHLFNGYVCHAAPSVATETSAWRDFGNSTQESAASRPWMPVPGSRGTGSASGPPDLAPYLLRYALPSNGVPQFEGQWYSFQVGSVLFLSLSAEDVAYRDAGTPLSARGYSGGAQTRWLERTLARARRDPAIDWIVIQMHQRACSSSATGNGPDLGMRAGWLPLFDAYEVELVLSGHDHGHEHSLPVRGRGHDTGAEIATSAVTATCRPRPVPPVDCGVLDTSLGTVHLVLGCGGTSANLDRSAADAADGPARARGFTKLNRPRPALSAGTYARGDGDAVEDAARSARRGTATGYGIAVLDVDPGTGAGGQTSITVTRYRAAGADPVIPGSGDRSVAAGDCTAFETFTLVRPRSDRRRFHARQDAAEA